MQALCAAVIFDIDGLLLDTERLAKEAWQRAAREFGYHISDVLFESVVGRKVSDAFDIFRRHLGADFPAERIRDQRLRYTDEWTKEHGVPIKVGATLLLDLLRRAEVPCCVATSTYRDIAVERLRGAGILSHFPIIVTGDEVVRGKPDPEIFVRAAALLQSDAAETVVLEDSEFGIEAAHRGGFIPIMVPDLKAPSAQTCALAYRIFSSLEEVAEYLPALLAKK